MRQQLFRILPYASGALLGALIFFPPAAIAALGPWQVPIWGAIMVLGLFAAVGLQIAVGLPESVTVEPIEAEPPREVAAWIEELRGLGFEPAELPLRIALRPAAVSWVMRNPEVGCWASVSQTGTLPRRCVYDLVSVFAGGEGELTSLAEPLAAVLPLPPGHLKQVFPGASPTVLLARHREAMEHLGRWGVDFERPTLGGVPERIRRGITEQRRAVLANPVRSAAVALWRAWSKRTPHERPIAEQPAVEAVILRRGRAAAIVS